MLIFFPCLNVHQLIFLCCFKNLMNHKNFKAWFRLKQKLSRETMRVKQKAYYSHTERGERFHISKAENLWV